MNEFKKARLRYIRCSKGGLHDGEAMNFICIDEKCKAKGIICPVCLNSDHLGHQTLHLKTFLNELNLMLISNESSCQLQGLSEYLRSLQNSKRDMLKAFHSTVRQVAEKVKEVQEKIENSYFELRKIILSQSTLSMKLPELYRLLTDHDSVVEDSEILRQINKYSELLEYKNKKIISVDSSLRLVNQYALKVGTLSAHLLTIQPELTRHFETLPLKLSKFGETAKVEVDASEPNFIFSGIEKATSIVVTENKMISISNDDMGGLAFISSDQPDNPVQSVSFRIVGSVSQSVGLGVANPDTYKAKNYILTDMDMTNIYGIYSMGAVINDYDGVSFVFGKGDVVKVSWHAAEKRLVISREEGVQKYEQVLSNLSDSEAKKLKIFASLIVSGDIVEIKG